MRILFTGDQIIMQSPRLAWICVVRSHELRGSIQMLRTEAAQVSHLNLEQQLWALSISQLVVGSEVLVADRKSVV